MILDTIDNAARYYRLDKGFQNAFEFLVRPDLKNLGTGKHEIQGNSVFAIISRALGRAKQDALVEIHNSYIDIQYIISGTDEMGWKPKSHCKKPAGPYDREKDIQFFMDQPDAWITVLPGSFVIFFPEDAHLPQISDGEIHKVVVKVKI